MIVYVGLVLDRMHISHANKMYGIMIDSEVMMTVIVFDFNSMILNLIILSY